ncbi:CalY family protein [Alicyclobacillus sp. SP_1]|uniref:CalY family protein n=1 Tax=Alicyclobacillus sp. SP_1 TaxID=2942475 RepID=UPI0021580785|nr:CalY family protein [Alicyclobacillus sp. SP_1]
MKVGISGKFGMAAATSLVGLAMMGAGSFALFTAHASTGTTSVAAGTVDVDVKAGAQAFSDLAPINMTNMVPGDTVGSYVVVKNSGSVNEVIDVNTHAHGPIFWMDGLNNGKITTESYYSSANGVPSISESALQDTNSKLFGYLTTDDTTYGHFANSKGQTVYNYWQPRLLPHPNAHYSYAASDGGFESYDYRNGDSSTYSDNNPAYYDISYGIYDQKPVVSMQPGTPGANGMTTMPSFTIDSTSGQPLSPVSSPIVSNQLTATYTEAGWTLPDQKQANASASTNFTESGSGAVTEPIGLKGFSGNTEVDGIVLAPGQYMVLEYTGKLPLVAGNDYQDAWGNVRVGIDAAQWENNHTPNPSANGGTGEGHLQTLPTYSSSESGDAFFVKVFGPDGVKPSESTTLSDFQSYYSNYIDKGYMSNVTAGTYTTGSDSPGVMLTFDYTSNGSDLSPKALVRQIKHDYFL